MTELSKIKKRKIILYIYSRGEDGIMTSVDIVIFLNISAII